MKSKPLDKSNKIGRELMVLPENRLPVVSDPLKIYMAEIAKIPVLSEEETIDLAKKLYFDGSLDAAKKLVQANLRLVVKLAFDYSGIYQNTMDLIQEGNMGLMKAVSKFDPTKNVKLSYYASWWIKSYILKYILDNYSLVKISSGKTQKKLFFNLLQEQEKLKMLGADSSEKINEQVSKNLGVEKRKIEAMSERLKSPELSISPDPEENREFILVDEKQSADEALEHHQQMQLLNTAISHASFTPNEQVVFDKRIISDNPLTLQEIADELHISRERARQLETQVLAKLKKSVDHQMTKVQEKRKVIPAVRKKLSKKKITKKKK